MDLKRDWRKKPFKKPWGEAKEPGEPLWIQYFLNRERHPDLCVKKNLSSLHRILQCLQEIFGRLHIFMDQAVSQHAKFNPALDGFYPSEFFSSLEVVELGPGTLKIDS